MKFQKPNLLALLICAATPLVAQAQSEAADAFTPSSAPVASVSPSAAAPSTPSARAEAPSP